MENYFIIANRLIAETMGTEYAILPESTVDTEDIFGFSYQSKRFLQTRDVMDMVVGQGPVLLSKVDQRLFVYGSAYSIATAMADLWLQLDREKSVRAQFHAFDFRHSYNLTVTRIDKKQQLMESLLRQGMTYILPEVVGEDIFRIPKPYTKLQLENRLKELPTTFHHKTGQWISRFYQENVTWQLCEMELAPYQKTERARNIQRATEEDLKPIW